MPDEPTMGEVLRRLDEAIRQIKALAADMRADRVQAAETYMRRDVYTSDRVADALLIAEVRRDVEEINRDRDSDSAWRRQMMLALAVACIGAFVALGIGLLNYLAR